MGRFHELRQQAMVLKNYGLDDAERRHVLGRMFDPTMPLGEYCRRLERLGKKRSKVRELLLAHPNRSDLEWEIAKGYRAASDRSYALQWGTYAAATVAFAAITYLKHKGVDERLIQQCLGAEALSVIGFSLFRKDFSDSWKEALTFAGQSVRSMYRERR